ncbi:MAG TPA: lysylphosphatidylglycerol synthase transmembrane domain-containing protein [Thermoanaerobaculia bacterium]
MPTSLHEIPDVNTEDGLEADPEAAPTPRERWRRWGGLALKVGLTALALVWTWRLLADIDWRELSLRLAKANGWWLAATVFFLFLRWSAWDGRFRAAARRGVGVAPPATLGFFVLLASAALNLITPSARIFGSFLRARYLGRSVSSSAGSSGSSGSFGLLYGIVLFDQVTHHAVMIAATCLAVVAAALAAGRPVLATASLGILLAATVALIVWVRRRGPHEQNPLVRLLARWAERADGRMQRFLAHSHEAVGVFVRLLGDGPLLVQAVLWGTAYVFFNAGAQWLIFRALGLPVNALVVFSAVSLGVAAGTVTGTPGGLGTTEAAMVTSFTVMGVSPVVAATTTLLYRGLHYVTVLAVGLPALLILEMKRGARGAKG